MSARVERCPDGSVAPSFAYRRWLVEAIKTRIPASERSYEPETRRWHIAPAWAAVAVGILESAFGRVDVVQAGASRPEPAPNRSTDRLYRELHLLPSAPPALVAAAYKALARLHHPDAGGTTIGMQRLNDAYERLKRGAA